MIFLTTTAIEIDEELLNRCLVLTRRRGPRADAGDPPSCSASGRRSRGCWRGGSRARCCKLHQNAQRLLKPLLVVNPYAPRADLPRRPHADAARPHEVPDADPRDRAAAPAPAAGEERRARGQGRAVHRGDARGHRGRQPAGARGAGPLARRAAAADAAAARCCSSEMVRAGCEQQRDAARRVPLHAARGARAHGLGLRRRSACTSSGWWSSSTCSCTAAAAARASSTSCSTTAQGKDGHAASDRAARRGQAGRCDCDAACRGYDRHLAGVEGRVGGGHCGVITGPKRGGGGVAITDEAER